MKNKNASSKKKVIILGLVVLLVAAGAFLAVRALNDKTQPEWGKDGINYGPPTSAEKKEAEDHKKDLQDRMDMEKSEGSNSSADKKSVTPVIVDANQYGDVVEVSAYVPGIIEDGGTCTITLTKDSSTVTRSITGSGDATTTRCPVVSIPRSEFLTAGSWSAKVTYSSDAAQGSSAASKFEIK